MTCQGPEGTCSCNLDWRDSTAEEFADAIEALCVQKDGKCQCEPCTCDKEDEAFPGW